MSSIVEVPFYADKIQATREGEQAWVVVKRVCENLGIAHEPQLTKLKAKDWAVCMTMSIMQTGDDQKRDVFCLDLESLPMWLATIDANRVAPEARFKLVTYQREAKAVLARHFFGAGEPAGNVSEVLAAALGALQATAETARAALEFGKDNARRIENIERHVTTGGAIPAYRHDALRREVWALAEDLVTAGRFAKVKSARSWLWKRLGEHVQWGATEEPWTEMPAAKEPDALACLRRIRRDLPKRPRGGRNGRQLSLIKNG
jgi:hypothetical protein